MKRPIIYDGLARLCSGWLSACDDDAILLPQQNGYLTAVAEKFLLLWAVLLVGFDLEKVYYNLKCVLSLLKLVEINSTINVSNYHIKVNQNIQNLTFPK